MINTLFTMCLMAVQMNERIIETQIAEPIMKLGIDPKTMKEMDHVLMKEVYVKAKKRADAFRGVRVR